MEKDGFEEGMPRIPIGNLTRPQQCELLSELWPEISFTPTSFDEPSYTHYFDHLGILISQFNRGHRRLFVDTFEDVVFLVRTLRVHPNLPLSIILQQLWPHFQDIDERAIKRSLELAIRLWLTININSRPLAWGIVDTYQRALDWSVELSLQDVLEERFARRPSVTAKKLPLIDGSFTAAYLVDVCGMTLNWTDYLSDHLRPDPNNQVLTVYKHKICLINHLQAPSAIPTSVLDEALNTMNLLFPFGDLATLRLLNREGHSEIYGLGNCQKKRELDLSKYSYWGEELETLLHRFHHPPKTWRQLVMDRRNLIEWAAFWMTVMMAFLTFVSIPCNIIQAAYSVKSYHDAKAQEGACVCSN